MAEGLNTATLIGNLGADPELRYAGDSPVLNMRLATTESYKDKDGERKESTQWHSIALWGPRAEALSKFLVKGSRLCVVGRIETRSYEKDGQKVYATSINATNVVLLDSKRDGDERSQGGGGGQRPQSQGSQGGGGQRPQTNGNGGQRPQQSGRPQSGGGQRPANGNAGGRPQTQRQQQPADDFAGEGGGGDFEGEGDSGGMPF